MDDSTKHLQPIFDYILDHVEEDERPFLKVHVLGTRLMGLLNSGASATVIGSL